MAVMAGRTRIGKIMVLMLCGMGWFDFGHAAHGEETIHLTGDNLVQNPSFERHDADAKTPEAWTIDSQVFLLETHAARTGHASLGYVNGDPRQYRFARQKLPLRPGAKYRIRAWIKTEKVAGKDSGASICLEWQDAEGKWLGGIYPTGVKQTRDWTLVEGIARLPEEASSCVLQCYLRRGMTGKAWFDDLEVRRVQDPPMRTVVLSPLYQGRITPSGPESVSIRVRLNLRDYELKPGELRIVCSLRSKDSPEPLTSRTVNGVQIQEFLTKKGFVDALFPTADLKPGRYDLVLRLVGPDGRELQTTSHRLLRVPEDFKPKCTFDKHRRLLIGDQPFFPLGMYCSRINEEDLATFAASKFNCLMAYGSPNLDEMNLAEKHGIRVIYSIKDWYAGSRWCPGDIKSVADEEAKIRERVRQFRDHPALLAWYLNDELPLKFMPRLNAHQRWVAEEDPNHPTWVVLYQVKQVGEYLDSFDVIGTDPYPIGRGPASMAAEWTAETFNQVERARPMWQVPQVFNWANYKQGEQSSEQHRAPTFDEMRSMAWQCIAEGATGLIFYSWYDLKRNPDVPFEVQWDRLKRIAAEVDSRTPVLLSVEPAPEIHAVEAATSQPAAWLHLLVRHHAGKTYLIAVNDGDGEGQILFTLPKRPKRVLQEGKERPLSVEGSTFTDELPKLAVKIYEIEP